MQTASLPPSPYGEVWSTVERARKNSSPDIGASAASGPPRCSTNNCVTLSERSAIIHIREGKCCTCTPPFHVDAVHCRCVPPMETFHDEALATFNKTLGQPSGRWARSMRGDGPPSNSPRLSRTKPRGSSLSVSPGVRHHFIIQREQIS